MTFFQRNLGPGGRWFRGLLGLLLCLAAALAAPGWLSLLLAAGGIFAIIEAATGWCAARACGIRTKF